MHGRTKVKVSAEEDEAKKAERKKKLQLYTSATARVFKKRESGELDDEALSLTSELLLTNPDFYTLWNYRRDVFQHLQSVRTAEEMHALFEKELSFTEACLKVSPKTYGSWQHRVWVLLASANPNWERELKLTTLFLQMDERNFHCWDYRRFVAAHSGVPLADELEFTTNKISSNFSNYSSWHYRSKLLPAVHADVNGPNGISAEVLCSESALVRNAVFTDPSDQSSWFYHRWLLGRPEQKLSLSCLYVNKHERILSATFTQQVPKDFLALRINSTDREADWQSPGRSSYSYVWTTVCTVSDGDIVTAEYHGSECAAATLHVDPGSDVSWCCNKVSRVLLSSGTWKLPAASLKEDLNNFLQLYELEPRNKWVLLTVVLLMNAVDFESYRGQVLQKLDELVDVDSYRQSYYKDLRSQILLEHAAEATHESQALDLQGLGLTRLCHMERFSVLRVLNVSSNCLQSLNGINSMQALTTLIASNNRVAACDGLANMPCLQDLQLANNDIHCLSGLAELKSCCNLRVVDLQGNVKICHLGDAVNEMLCHVKSIRL